MEKYAILLNRATKCDRLYCSFTTNNNNKNGLRQRHTSNDSTISQRVACVCMCVCVCCGIWRKRNTERSTKSHILYENCICSKYLLLLHTITHHSL